MILKRSISDSGDGRLHIRLNSHKPQRRSEALAKDSVTDSMTAFLQRADVHTMIVDGALDTACSDASDTWENVLEELAQVALQSKGVRGFFSRLFAIKCVLPSHGLLIPENTPCEPFLKQCRAQLKEWHGSASDSGGSPPWPVILSPPQPPDVLHPDTFFEGTCNGLSRSLKMAIRVVINAAAACATP